MDENIWGLEDYNNKKIKITFRETHKECTIIYMHELALLLSFQCWKF